VIALYRIFEFDAMTKNKQLLPEEEAF